MTADAPSDPTAPDGVARVAVLAGLVVLLAGLALTPGVIDNIDTRIAFRGAQSFLSRGTFALEDPTALEREFLWTGRGVDGAIYSKFGTGLSVLLLPFLLAGRVVAEVVPLPAAHLEELFAAFASPVLTAVGVAALVRMLVRHVGVSLGAAVVGALSWALCTFQFAYTGSAYLETPVAVCGVLAVALALDARAAGGRQRLRFAAAAGASAGAMVAVKVALVVLLPFVLLPLLDRDRRATLLRLAAAAVPLTAIAAWLLALNHVRYGNPLSTGYVQFDSLFETPLLVGLGHYAFDPDLSLFLYAPAFTLAVFGLRSAWRRAPVLVAAALSVFAVDTVLHALHTGYHGGTVYGPRYLIGAIPLPTAIGVACLADGANVARRRVLAAALGVALVLQLPSVLVSPIEYHTLRGEVRARGGDLEAIHPRVPTDWRLLAKKLAGETRRYDLADFATAGATLPRDTAYDVPRMDRGLAIWWVLAASEGRRSAYVPGALLLLGTAAAGVVLVRSLGASAGRGDRVSPLPAPSAERGS